MTEMIERVARRLADVHFRRKQHVGACSQDERVAYLVNAHWRNHVLDARAAIEAMRRPTQEMYEALCATDKMWNELTSNLVWSTYIDAALGKSNTEIGETMKIHLPRTD